MSVVRSGIQSPEIGIVHVTIIRLHHSSDSGKNPPSQKYFAKVTINDAVETTKDKTLIQGWNEDFTFEIPVPCKFAIKVFRRRKLRRWSDVLIGSYTEDLEALLIRSFDKSISEPLPSGSQLNAGTSKFLIEFKVNLKDQDVVGAISAMVQRVKIQASRLAKSQAMHDSASFNRMQLIGDIHFVNIVEIWDHLLEKLQIFANLADKVAEVHPYAKAAYSVISMAYKAVMKQLERDANINCLILAMDDIYSFVKEAEPLQQIESHKLIMARLAQQTTECGYFISAYCVDTFLMRTVKYAVSPVDAAITMYGSKLNELKSALLAHSTINTEITVLRIWETVKKLEMKIDINDLPYANGVRFQSDKQCLPETQEGILHTIINWIDDLSNGDQRIFVLTGLPGTGKSAIAHSISSHYHSVGRLGSSIFADLPKPESYTSTGLPVLLFPTMARDLADLDIQFRNALWTVIESDRALTKTIGISDQCEKFILGPSTSLTISGPIVIVLDGLDDCLESTDLYAFLKVLANKSHHLPPNFRILLIARNDSHILQHLAGNPVVIFYSMEVDEWVMKCELSQVCRKTLLPYFTQEKLEPIIVELVERARGSFRWIIEACETICGNTFQQETSALSGYKALIVSFGKSSEPIREPVAQNDCLYMEELSRLHRTYGTLFSTQFKPVMGYLLAAYTPLSMLELIRLGRLDDRLLAQFLTAMESLLTNTHRRYQPIGPVHASFYKFLGHSICSKEFSVDIAEYHFDLGRACLQIIDNELKSNVDNLTLLYNPESQELYVGGSFQRYIKVELSYACRFWLKHLKTALGRGLKALNTEVQIGLRAKLQYWCSILHIPGSVGGAIEALHQIMSTMLVSLGSQSLAAVPSVVVLLIDEDSKVRKAVVNCIPELAKHEKFHPIIAAALSQVLELLKDENFYVRGAAVNCLSKLSKHDKFHSLIGIAQSRILMSLKDENSRVRMAAVHFLSEVAKHEKFHFPIATALSKRIQELLEDQCLHVRQVTIDCLSKLAKHEKIHAAISAALSIILELLSDVKGYTREAAVNCLCELAKHEKYQPLIANALLNILEALEDSNSFVRISAVKCLSELAKHEIFHPPIAAALSRILELLKDEKSYVRSAVMSCLPELAKHEKFHLPIVAALEIILESLNIEHTDIRMAAISCLPELAKYDKFQGIVSTVLSNLPALLKDLKSHVGYTVVNCLSELAKHETLHLPIVSALPRILEPLQDSGVRIVTVNCLPELAKYGDSKKHHSPIAAALSGILESLQDKDSVIRMVAVSCLPELAKNEKLHLPIAAVLERILESFNIENSDVRRAAINCLPELANHDKFQSIVSTLLSSITQLLKHVESQWRYEAINCLSELAKHEKFHFPIVTALPKILELMEDLQWYVRAAVVNFLHELAKHERFHPLIETALSRTLQSLEDHDSTVRKAVVYCLSEIAKHEKFHPTISAALSMILKCLKDVSWYTREAVLNCLSKLTKHEKFHSTILTALSTILESLKDASSDVRRAAAICLSELVKYEIFHPPIATGLSRILKSLRDKNSDVRRAAVRCLSKLAKHERLHSCIVTALSQVLESSKDEDADIRCVAVHCLSELSKHAELSFINLIE